MFTQCRPILRIHIKTGRFLLASVAMLLLSTCSSLPIFLQPNPISTSYTVTPLATTDDCTGSFTPIDLKHRIEWLGDPITNFDTIGSGLALGDLDNDGDIDLVFANLAHPLSIYWNEGSLKFRIEPLTTGATRAVNMIDFDGDNWLDLALTHPASPPSLWLNQGIAGDDIAAHDRFQRVATTGARYIANTMGWADLDHDGDLDLVTGSYNSELGNLGDGFAIGGGVSYYENQGSKLELTVIAPTAEALAILLTDLNEDNKADIVIGNDYVHPDHIFVKDSKSGNNTWVEKQLFESTATNTMSYDIGDIDNNGRMDLFSADMKPYEDSPSVIYSWERITILPPPDSIQSNENVLLIPHGTGDNLNYINEARSRGLDATGWTWSAKFGDLDSDGNIDLYAVNGMIDSLVFGHLSNDELVERNQARRNKGNGIFVPAPEWELGSERSGRGMSMADLDGDGDLDVVVSNMSKPSQIFENRLCGGSNILIDLRQPHSQNTRAIGAEITLYGERAGTLLELTRRVRSQSGYLSGDTSRIHFGIPSDTVLDSVRILWPDNNISYVPMGEQNVLIEITYPTKLSS